MTPPQPPLRWLPKHHLRHTMHPPSSQCCQAPSIQHSMQTHPIMYCVLARYVRSGACMTGANGQHQAIRVTSLPLLPETTASTRLQVRLFSSNSDGNGSTQVPGTRQEQKGSLRQLPSRHLAHRKARARRCEQVMQFDIDASRSYLRRHTASRCCLGCSSMTEPLQLRRCARALSCARAVSSPSYPRTSRI